MAAHWPGPRGNKGRQRKDLYSTSQYEGTQMASARMIPRRMGSVANSLAPDDSISVRGDDPAQEPLSRYGDDEWLRRDPYTTDMPPEPYAPHSYADPYHSGHDSYDTLAAPEYLSRSGSHDPLVINAAPPGGSKASLVGSRHSFADSYKYAHMEDEKAFDNQDYPPQLSQSGILPPEKRPSWLRRQLRDPTPLDQRIEQYRRGIGVQNRAWLCWVICLACVIAFICECANNWKATGTPIAIHPTFNWLIGPASSVLINSGARFDPCIKTVPSVIDLPFACINNTANPITQLCTLEEVCGFGGFPPSGPNQAFRFVLPIFLHAGLIHIAINMIVQLTSSAQVEKEMGSLRFLFVYFPSGIFGFILGGNFALVGLPSVGASGAIFGTHAAVFVDLISHWGLEQNPKKRLIFLLLEIIVGIGLGYVPGVDNFSHLGGFAMGLLMCILLYPSLHRSRRHRLVVYGLRVIAAPLIILAFVLLVRNFYTSDPDEACEWCRYLSCWPTDNNNHCQGTGLTLTNATSTST